MSTDVAVDTSVDCRLTYRSTGGRVSVDWRPSVGQVSAVCRPICGRRIDRSSVNCRSTDRPTVGRDSIGIWFAKQGLGRADQSSFGLVAEGQNRSIMFRTGLDNNNNNNKLWGTGIERHGGWQLAWELLPSFPCYHMVRQNYTRRKREDRQSSSPESVKPPSKAAKSLTDTNEDESVMAASSTEEANISLEDIKETLDSIQATIEKVLFENGQVKTELKELKASLEVKDREVKSLQESLSKTRETNQLLKAELEAAKTKIKKTRRGN